MNEEKRRELKRQVDEMPGLKQSEIRKCAHCTQGVAHDGNLTFYRIHVERYILDPGAIQERHGLELMMGGGMGGAALAGVLGPNKDIAKQLDKSTYTICQDCILNVRLVELEIKERSADEGNDEHTPDARSC